MKNIIYILLALIIVSCDVQKVSDKTKDNSNYKEDTEVRTFRKGDTVRFEIPKISFKDTIIYRTNKQGTTIQTVYDNKGTIKSIDCYASRIEELTRQNIEYQKNIKEKQSEKTEEFNTTWALYFATGFVIIIIVALLLMFLYIKKNTAVVSALLSK
jgi:hypothetical protein